MGLYKNKCSSVPVFILHNKLFQVKWARIPVNEEKVPSFLKMAGTFKGQVHQRSAGQAGTAITHHDRFQRPMPGTPHSKRKSLRGFSAKALFQHLFHKEFLQICLCSILTYGNQLGSCQTCKHRDIISGQRR